LQTERFNREAQRLSADIVIYTISMDLPFAQKRWIEENQVHNVITASDFNTADFGIKYGILLKEIRLLTRAVFIIGRDDHIVYMQIVPEITEEPDYAAVLEAIGKIK